jgi:hypothetical protein
MVRNCAAFVVYTLEQFVHLVDTGKLEAGL